MIIVWKVPSLSTTTREMVGRIRSLVLCSSLVRKMKSTPAAVLPDVVLDVVCSVIPPSGDVIMSKPCYLYYL